MLAERGRHRRLGVPERDSPIWIVAVLFVVQGAGLGLAVPAATFGVMEALPRERARRRVRADQHRAPGRGGAQRRGPRLDPLLRRTATRSTPRCRRSPRARGTRRARRSPPPRRSRPSSATQASSCWPRRTPRSWTRCGSPRASRRPSPSSAASRCCAGCRAASGLPSRNWSPRRSRPPSATSRRAARAARAVGAVTGAAGRAWPGRPARVTDPDTDQRTQMIRNEGGFPQCALMTVASPLT